MEGDPVILQAEQTVTALFDELRRPLARYLVCLGMRREEAREVVQDAFLKLHRHVAAGGSRENLRSWLFRVAHNQARNCQKSSRPSAMANAEDGAGRADPAAGPEQLLLEKERMERLASAMAALPEIHRECLHLRAEGLRYREIAEVLGIGVSTVAEHLDRAIRKLGKELP